MVDRRSPGLGARGRGNAMPPAPSAPFERRHTPRVNVSGNAIVHAAAQVVRCDIVNLSMGGVLLRSTENVAIGVPFGAPVTVELHLDAEHSAWFRLRGHVHRLDQAAGLCVSFHHISPQFEDLMGDEVLAVLEGERSPRVLVVDLSPERRAKVAQELRSAGCVVVEVATPLDAIAAIEQSKAHIELALVSEWPAGTEGALMAFLRDVHPEIELATIADRPRGAHDQAGFLFANQAVLGGQIGPLLRSIALRRGHFVT
jgi:hypothetical protein